VGVNCVPCNKIDWFDFGRIRFVIFGVQIQIQIGGLRQRQVLFAASLCGLWVIFTGGPESTKRDASRRDNLS